MFRRLALAPVFSRTNRGAQLQRHGAGLACNPCSREVTTRCDDACGDDRHRRSLVVGGGTTCIPPVKTLSSLPLQSSATAMNLCRQNHRAFSSSSFHHNDHQDDDGDGVDLSPDTEHMGTVRSVMGYGAFIRIDGTERDGLLHVSEISRSKHIMEASDVLEAGDRVKVRIIPDRYHSAAASDEGDGTQRRRLRLSMKRVKPVLPDDFDPVTVVVFGLPYDMTSEEVEAYFSNEYGPVVEVSLSPTEMEYRREYTFITFYDRQAALACIKSCRRIPYQLGREPPEEYRVKVKMGRKQTYKARQQERLDEEWERWQAELNMTPEERRVQRMAQRALRDIIPYYDM